MCVQPIPFSYAKTHNLPKKQKSALRENRLLARRYHLLGLFHYTAAVLPEVGLNQEMLFQHMLASSYFKTSRIPNLLRRIG